jgi:hypothetical protein
MNLIKVDIQFEYIHPLRCSLGYKSSTKHKILKLRAALYYYNKLSDTAYLQSKRALF